jgi:hypothetical protein
MILPNVCISKTEFLGHVWHHLGVSDQYGRYGSQMIHTSHNMPEFFTWPVVQPQPFCTRLPDVYLQQ